ncbi:MAG: class I SAM-dependent RNA methyltransferase [Syntrophaceae bacterium]
MERGDEIELKIDTVAFGGAGVGRYGKMVVFVPFTVGGDTVSAKIVAVKKRFATADLKFVHTPSPFRIIPRCAAYTRCGSCSYQHIAYDHQVVLKNGQVHDALKRIGRFDTIPLEDMIPSPQAYRYRGKADFHVTPIKGKKQVIGFAARATNNIVDLERCEIVHESINDALLIMRRDGSPAGRWPLWSAPTEEVSESRIMRLVKGRELLVPRDGFFQTNLYLVDTLIDVVMEFCDLSGTETVIDGYCGSGIFSLFLAPRCGRLYGIESEGNATRCAEENIKRAGIKSAVFYTGDMACILREQFIRERIPVDIALVDPPRIGLGLDTINALSVLNPPKIVYVSCNPTTLARDLRLMVGFGYSIIRVQPLDMFPQTSHIETVVLLEQTPTQ